MKRCFSSPEHETAPQLRWSGRSENEATPDGHPDAELVRPAASSATGGLASQRAIDYLSQRRRKDLCRQTPSIWLRRSVGLAAWLWLAPGAEALPTYTPIVLNHPNPQADARFAEAAAAAGDVNGDGAPDLLVGAPFQILGGNLNQGRAFVFSGADRSLLLTLDDPTPQGLALFGSAVAGAGDVNRDGRADLLVGAPGQRVGGRANQGQAYVLSGADGRLLLTLDNPTPQADAAFGAAVAGIGDVNSDGLPDLLVGAPEQDEGGSNRRGQAFVFSGADGSVLRTLRPTQSVFVEFGSAVAAAGDVNGDGAPDLLVGDGFGAVVPVFSGADGSVLRTLDRPPPNARSFGRAVAGIGDVNGDGAPDLLVGAPGADVGGEAAQGRAFVFSGADASLLRTLDLPLPQFNAQLASAVAAAGDVNGDGVPDLLAGAPGRTVPGGVSQQGQAFVFSGTDASVLLTLDTPTPDSSADFGDVVAGIGDVDGDGAPDFLVGAPSHDVGGRVRQGRAFVFVSAPVPPDPAGAVPLVPASTQVACNSARCRVPVTCNLAAALGTPCTNRIGLFVRAPRRLAEDAAGKAPRRVRFASVNATNVPPGQTETVRLTLTRQGKRIVSASTTKTLRGVIEIRNAPGTIIDTTPVRIRLRLRRR
jgi:FG-GAP repeat protein